MKKQVFFILIFCMMLEGCSGTEDAVKGTIDLKGTIVEIDQSGRRILMENKDYGRVWVKLHENGEIEEFENGQEIVVWVDGEIKESWPAQAKALNIEQIQK